MSDRPVLKYVLRRGELDPKRLRIRIDAAGIETADRVIPDLTAVTAVLIEVVDKNTQAVETWTTTVVQQSADLVVVDHLLQLTDTEVLRSLHAAVWATATGAAHPVYVGALDLQVVAP